MNRILTEAKQKEIFALLESGVIRPEQKTVVLFNKLDPRILAQDLEEASSDQGVSHKPDGLWYACGDAWLNWCAYNFFNPGRYVYELMIDPRSNVLRLDSDDLVASFTESYGVMRYGMVDRIDWTRIASEFSGVEVCPYPWTSPDWLLSWDVASGCIWDPRAVAGMRLIHIFKT